MFLLLWMACGKSEPPVGGGGGDEPPPPPPTACRNDGEERADAVLYADETLDFSLTLSPAAIAGLATVAGEVVPDVPAVFMYDGQRFDVGVHLRGGMGSFQPFDAKPGFQVDFGFADAAGRFLGLRYLTLKNNVQDDGMLAEHVAYALSTWSGVPAPRHGYARLTVNDELFGLYGLVEAVESQDFVERCFGDGSGPLYEGQMDDLTAAMVEGYTVILDGGLGADALAPLRTATTTLDAADGAGWTGALDSVIDPDTMRRLMAVEIVTGNPDGYVAWENNYYLYLDHADERLRMITWGPDQAFWEHLNVKGAYPGRLWTDCKASVDCFQALQQEIREVALVLRSSEWLDWLDQEAARTEADCMGDPRSPGGADACAAGRDRLYSFIAARPDEVNQRLGGEP